MFRTVIAILVTLVVARTASAAGELPPVVPVLPGSDHFNENHAGSDLSYKDLTDVQFEEANLSDTTFYYSVLGRANMKNAWLHRADLRVHTAWDAQFQGAILDDAVLENQSAGGFERADFSGASLVRANLSRGDFEYTIFDGANLSFADLEITRFRNASFHNANLTSADFEESFMWEAVLTRATLTGADMDRVDLRYGDLRFVEMLSGTLRDAELLNVDMRGAKFQSVDFTDANLYGAQLQSAKFYVDLANFETANFDSRTIYDGNTVFPAGFDPVAHGLTFVPEPPSIAIAMIACAVFGAAMIRTRRNAL